MQEKQFPKQSLNKTFSLAAATAAALLMFSFLGAPFVRVLANTVKSLTFWVAGILLVTVLFILNLSVASVYVGAVWMTLGFYSELEKRGLNWKKTALVALGSGFLFAVVSFYVLSKGSLESEFVKNMVLPIEETLKKALAETDTIKSNVPLNIISYMPGVFASALLAALAFSFIFESNIFQLFKIKREKVVTAIKWLEFRLPDTFIWLALLGFFFSLVDLQVPLLKITAINISVFCIVAFFFQGIAVIEFFTRANRMGFFTKVALYMLIIGWLGPVVSVIGLLDYWADFRKMLRKKLK